MNLIFKKKSYNFKLSAKVENSKTNYHTKSGWIIKLTSNEKKIGFGEVSPLHKEDLKKCAKQLDMIPSYVGLFNVENKLPNELSGGMQKRVSFARALITDQTLTTKTKPLLLFDEPTAGLDPIASSRIEDLINKTNDKANGSSIVVSHVLSTIERTSDKVLMLYGGKFRWAGSSDEFKESNDPYVFQFRHGKLDCPMQPKDI